MRGRPGQSRYRNKRTSIITFGEFQDLTKKVDVLIWKSLLALLYYVGLRTAEIVGDDGRKWKVLSPMGRTLAKDGRLPEDWIKADSIRGLWEWRTRDPLPGILKEDITLDGNTLRIFSEPIKHGERKGTGQLELDIRYPYVDSIVEQWRKTAPESKVWDVSPWSVWNFISTISNGELYPHAFRMSRATRIARNPEMSISDMQQWFGWARASTADNYITPIRSVSKVRDSIRNEIPDSLLKEG